MAGREGDAGEADAERPLARTGLGRRPRAGGQRLHATPRPRDLATSRTQPFTTIPLQPLLAASAASRRRPARSGASRRRPPPAPAPRPRLSRTCRTSALSSNTLTVSIVPGERGAAAEIAEQRLGDRDPVAEPVAEIGSWTSCDGLVRPAPLRGQRAARLDDEGPDQRHQRERHQDDLRRQRLDGGMDAECRNPWAPTAPGSSARTRPPAARRCPAPAKTNAM